MTTEEILKKQYTLGWWIGLLRECESTILCHDIGSKEAYRYTILSDWIAARIIKYHS